MTDGATHDRQRLVTQLGSPLRVTLLEVLLDRSPTALGESALARETSALIEDVRGCLAPLVADGWLTQTELAREPAWAVTAAHHEVLWPEVAEAAARMAPLLGRLRLAHRDAFSHLVGDGPRMRLVFEQAKVAARTNVPVLLTGETGTGKELVAWAIHRLSERAGRPFQSVNAGAIPPTLFEAELFGHERGAFTGAKKKRVGHLVAADGGTFFLDEIGELPLASQAKLLRVLQDKLVTPVGGAKEVATDFRLVSATNRDLAKMGQDGLFREDLRYRVNVLEIRMPSLRERPEDVPALARHFLELASWRHGVPACSGIDDDALDLLSHQRWPGNVRELENVVYRAALHAGGGTIDAESVTRALTAPAQAAAMGFGAASDAGASGSRRGPITRRPKSVDDAVRDAVTGAIERHAGNVSAAARELGISRVTLYKKLRELGLGDGV